MISVHFVVHESFEAPGAYETWAKDRGHNISYTRLYLGDTLPECISSIDLLIVLGGPQRPSTTKEECPHFDAVAEQDMIMKCIAGGKAVIGICLGAQLVGESLGASWEESPEREIGSFPITLTEAGQISDKFKHFGPSLQVGHWHSDMPGLTPDAKIIASSLGCPRQIVEYTSLVYGFQCHMEFNNEVIEALIEASADELPTLTQHRFVQQAQDLRRNNYGEMNQNLFTFLDRLQDSYAWSRSQA
ncbi:GMP synthase family protein [Aaosphaeria arxii CBS 175.79]|uniref:GMP synthase family protein n=1 Tax=Aaosphaeria arxii CBS 175.79 TaxID=1450172 RepID=A0A6A5Y8L2_9PLEO|nr:GMP synthase family protein [Aaosphaeria arxii CBS 175.79]KAF2021656.1 GMP synthase family protein [Aaosphaeria arxii CBS 175.79]